MSVILLDIIAEHIKNDKIRDVCNLGKMSHGNGFSMAFSSWIQAEQRILEKEKLILQIHLGTVGSVAEILVTVSEVGSNKKVACRGTLERIAETQLYSKMSQGSMRNSNIMASMTVRQSIDQNKDRIRAWSNYSGESHPSDL
ncbi:hypothetical protein KQX54_020025 [Cotesia glomerata]|uniref:Uncharacterized protein n=1 Tax=Cotesia glomerata TaxID=32391 RepID=A0AAV7I6D1_COTGL|nr:hypothetical protein KQX54_020025 [Cotesia glomerata]